MARRVRAEVDLSGSSRVPSRSLTIIRIVIASALCPSAGAIPAVTSLRCSPRFGKLAALDGSGIRISGSPSYPQSRLAVTDWDGGLPILWACRHP